MAKYILTIEFEGDEIGLDWIEEAIEQIPEGHAYVNNVKYVED